MLLITFEEGLQNAFRLRNNSILYLLCPFKVFAFAIEQSEQKWAPLSPDSEVAVCSTVWALLFPLAFMGAHCLDHFCCL